MTPAVVRWEFVAYALLMLVGGAMGASKSPVSLIAGVVCGGLAVAGAVMIPGNPKVGVGLGLAGAALGVIGMLPRYLKGHAIWPAGVVLLASLITLILAIIALVQSSKSGS